MKFTGAKIRFVQNRELGRIKTGTISVSLHLAPVIVDRNDSCSIATIEVCNSSETVRRGKHDMWNIILIIVLASLLKYNRRERKCYL